VKAVNGGLPRGDVFIEGEEDIELAIVVAFHEGKTPRSCRARRIIAMIAYSIGSSQVPSIVTMLPD